MCRKGWKPARAADDCHVVCPGHPARDRPAGRSSKSAGTCRCAHRRLVSESVPRASRPARPLLREVPEQPPEARPGHGRAHPQLRQEQTPLVAARRDCRRWRSGPRPGPGPEATVQARSSDPRFRALPAARGAPTREGAAPSLQQIRTECAPGGQVATAPAQAAPSDAGPAASRRTAKIRPRRSGCDRTRPSIR